VSIWGGRVLREDGRIDHNRLSDIVFSDTAELRKLTDLMHPMIEERQNGLIETYLSDNKVVAIVLDVPLLYEVGWEKHCDCVVFVFCEDEVRHERIRQSRNWDVEKIKKIENFQLALDKKAEISEYTVVNKSSIPDLAKQVDILLALVLEEEK
jgi:dephospho-CoA kinase